jgi:hypothetical protein
MDFDIRPYDLAGGAQGWLLIVGVLCLVGIGLAFVLSVARNGAAGVAVFANGLGSYAGDILSVSPRRVFALTKLTLMEAVRRKALLVFVVFSILLMFAGWFLADANERPELQVSVHVTFLLTSIAWLILPAVMFLSCWALPEDIRIRSLHTVVTKPARRLEIVMGRMLGMGLVAMIVLVLMGVIGLVWINRQLPASSKGQLTCRVPLFGELYFFDIDGQPTRQGINVGDVWMYRSHITGNSRARAVWLFSGIDETALIRESRTDAEGRTTELDGLKLECRFEAFRTIKGSEKSIRQGVQAQYTLSANPREEAFGMISQSEPLRALADALRDAQFRTASDKVRELAARIRTAPKELRIDDYQGLTFGLATAANVLTNMKDPRLEATAKLFGDSANAGLAVSGGLQKEAAGEKVDPPYTAFSDALETLATGLTENADELHEALPRLEVPLPSFHISEYHEGADENLTFVPRTLRFAADYETLSRFLSALFEEWNSDGKLIEGTSLKASLIEDFSNEAKISTLNAEVLVAVLQEQLAAGSLKIADNKLAVADGRRWFTFFDDLIRREVLVAKDSEGWMIEKDLISDLTHGGMLRIEVACLNDQMYLGMARPDLFVRKPDRSFAVGYSKALLNIALMLLLIIVLGVTVSCVVKGPVALFFTLTFFVVGQFFHQFMMEKLSGQSEGMGTLESAVLIAQHRNPQVGMDVSVTTQKAVQFADKGLEGILWGFSNIVPDFSAFNRGAIFVENGFDVPFRESVLPAIAIFFGFLIPCILLSGALLKFRELEAK